MTAPGAPPADAGAAPRHEGTLGDGLAMSLAAGGAAAVGALGWVIAARSLTPAELGTATAFVSAFLLVTGVTEVNLGIGLLRWLPAAGPHAGVLLRRGLSGVAALTAVGAAGYLLLPGAGVIVDAVVGPGGDRLLGAAVFVAAAVAYALFQQQDFVLVGLGRPWWAPVRTGLFALGRVAILLAAGASLTSGLVVVSWTVPTAVCVLLVGGQTALLVRRRRRAGGPGVLPARRAVVGFLGPTYAGQVATAVLLNQVPLLVVMRFGPGEGGAFFLLWQVVTVVDVVAVYFASSAAAGVAREPQRAAEICARTRRHLLVLVLPLLGVGLPLARPALAVFGPEYATHAAALQVMLVGLALRMLVVHRLAEHQALGRGVRFARLAVLTTAGVVAVVLLAPADAADPALVVACGFVAVQAVAAAVVTLRRRGEVAAAPGAGVPA